MYNELDISIDVIVSQLSGHCDVMGNRRWRHQQNENLTIETRDDVQRSPFLSSFIDLLCHVRNKVMYVGS